MLYVGLHLNFLCCPYKFMLLLYMTCKDCRILKSGLLLFFPRAC